MRNKEDIIQRYRNTITNLNEAIKMQELNNPVKERDLKLDAAIQLNNVLEWGMKYHLKSLNKINWNDDVNLHQLIEKMKEFGEPSIVDPNCKINIMALKQFKSRERNPAEHRGEEPNLNKLIYCASEVEKFVKIYLSPSVPLPILNDSFFEEFGNWNEFLVECEDFKYNDINYILVTGPMQGLAEEKIKNIAKLPVKIVIDFDPYSYLNGFHYSYKEINPLNPYDLDIKTILRKPIEEEQKRIQWFFANGKVDLEDSNYPQYKNWKKAYDRPLNKLAEDCAVNFNNPIKIIFLHDDYEHNKKVMEIFYKHFEENIQFLFAVEQLDNYNDLLEEYDTNSKGIDISLEKIAEGSRDFIQYQLNNGVSNAILIPQKGGVNIELQLELFTDMEQYLEIIHRDVGKIQSSNGEDKEFYKGGIISWQDLRLKKDIEVEIVNSLDRRIYNKLISGESGMIFLTHKPGIGGTTIGRRLAFKLRTEFPTVILKKYKENDTASKLNQIYEITKKSIFILAETSITPLEQIENLVKEMQVKNRPIIVLVVKRGRRTNTISKSVEVSEVYFDRLDSNIDLFKKKYIELVEDIETEIDRKVYKKNKIIEETNKSVTDIIPFNLGLIVFENEYKGLKEHINKFLKLVQTEEQKKILIYLSLVYNYTGKGLSNSFFVNLLKIGRGVEGSLRLNLYEFLPEGFESVIVKEVLFGENSVQWRPSHQLIAEQIKMSLTSGTSDEIYWDHNLADYAIQFIKDSVVSGTQKESMLDILQELFIRRNSEELKDERFSALISDIPTDAGKEKVLLALVEAYPDEAHFQAHLARYYSFVAKNPKKALEYINNAIEIKEIQGLSDPLLFHIKGMCIRSNIYEIVEKLISNFKREKSIPSSDDLNQLKYLVTQASEQFKISREMNLDSHGYVANIQLLVKVVDFGFITSGYTKRDEFISKTKDSWYIQCIDEAESLLEFIKRLKDSDGDTYIEQAETDVIEKFYGDYNFVIQQWNSVLEKSSDKRLARRRLTRAYYKNAGGFNKMDVKTLKRIATLMEDNIREEPNNQTNIHLWFSAARNLEDITLQSALDFIGKWKIISNQVDIIYYLYILNFMQFIEGHSENGPNAINYIRESKDYSLNKKLFNRTKIYEWLGEGKGLKSLINANEFRLSQEKDEEDIRKWVRGTVSEVEHDGKGKIEYNGFEVFFQPSMANYGKNEGKNKVSKVGFTKDDIGEDVYFKLGFSYDGLIADFKTVISADLFNSEKEHIANDKNTFNFEKIDFKFEVGNIIEVMVRGYSKSHVDCLLENNELGQIYIGELANYYVKNIANEVEINEKIKVVIIGGPDHKGKWNLSRKAILLQPQTTYSNDSMAVAFKKANKKSKIQNDK